MTNRLTFVGVASAQLGAQLVGLTVAIRRARPYDVPWVGRGEVDAIGGDLWDKGTALSAPVAMLGAQTAAISLLAAGPNGTVARVAAKALAGLGAVYVAGYAGERVVRERLSPGGWDPVETPVAAVGLALATTMCVLGLGPVGDR